MATEIPYGVVDNVRGCNIGIEIKLKSRYYAYFQTINPGKSMRTPYFSAMY